ncbi:phosphopantetheine-binding protein [Pseudoalteromonas maricaloris]|uniref:phosphopantetheine-binding protein n=1 Tax=Pseudoalteromonas maricaloris TaxID=184924 RepID=UPI003C143026
MACRANLAETVKAFWESALDISNINPDVSFFDCGGNSLGCIQMLASLICSLNIEIDFDLFFDNPTLRNLQALVVEAA